MGVWMGVRQIIFLAGKQSWNIFWARALARAHISGGHGLGDLFPWGPAMCIIIMFSPRLPEM
jgi:hypothetical protein